MSVASAVATAAKKTVKAIVPEDKFRAIYLRLPKSASCARKWCPYSRTTCHVRELLDGLRLWWAEENGNAPGFAHYERVIQNCIRVENRLYWCFWTSKMKPYEETYRMFAEQVRAAFTGKPLDTENSWMY